MTLMTSFFQHSAHPPVVLENIGMHMKNDDDSTPRSNMSHGENDLKTLGHFHR